MSDPLARRNAPRAAITSSTVLTLLAAAAGILLILVAAGLTITHEAMSGVGENDLSFVKDLAAHRTDFKNDLTRIGSGLASTEAATAVALASCVALRLWLGRWYESCVLLVALGGELAIFLTCTAIVRRARPDVLRLDAAPPTSSFPSGHTAAAVAVYGFLAVVVWRYVVNRAVAVIGSAALLCLPLFVATSRLYRGAHFPSDVLASALFAGTWLTVVVLVLLPTRVSRPQSVDA